MNKQEFTQHVLEAENSMYHVAKSIAVNEADCEDAVQQAILTAYDKLSSLRNVKYFKTWLIRILINECYRIIRNRKCIVSFEDYMSDVPVESCVDLELREAVFKLPQKIRTVIVLYYIEGYSIDETSYMLRVPKGTVKSRMHKGRKLLKDMLNDEI